MLGNTGGLGEKISWLLKCNTIIFQFRIYIYIWLTRGRVDCYLIYWQLGATGSKHLGNWKIRVWVKFRLYLYTLGVRLWNYEANLFFGRNSLLSFDRNTFGLMCRCLRRHWRMKMWNCWRLMSKEARWKYCKVPGRVFNRSKGEKSICSSQILPATKTYTRINLY